MIKFITFIHICIDFPIIFILNTKIFHYFLGIDMTSDHLSNKEALSNIRKRLDISLTHIPSVNPSLTSTVTTTTTPSIVSHKPKLSVIPSAVMMNPAWQQHAEIMKQSLSLLALQRSQQSSVAAVATPVDLSPFVPVVPPSISVCGANSSMTSSNSNASAQPRRNINQGVSHPIPFKCPLCSLVYRTQTFLNEHMRKEHSVLI